MSPLNIHSDWRGKVFRQAAAFGIKGQQILDVISLTRNVIKEELHTEVKKGQNKPVLQFLLNQSIQHGKNILFDKIIQRVAGRLILRLGIPGGLAVSIATLIVPILLKGLTKKAMKNVNVQNLIARLDARDQLPDLSALKTMFRRQDPDSAAA
ncbi:hypothetical protein AHMF7605_06165 [Adhaeribacter arboris]|uniref:Uncharacterized protein n=1 Tax=Adhaeribacter arboris TaxID=2072846 RepID=A0A2T2YCB9_9BACT|nr:hypothetical protein [Adhaeribacter arboris]PSR53143.1 hypothetical protein AHMF7605_06165 [Adhaeribacter arboris]